MGRRERRRRREGEQPDPLRGSTSDYADPEGNVLTLRNSVSEGTLRQLRELDAKRSATAEDRWQRRVELLFEHLAVRWEIAGLPLESQKELLGRYRIAGAEERSRVREILAQHLRERYPEIQV